MKRACFELERGGEFTFKSWCWEAGERTLTYKIHIRTHQLDEKGFVFDNREIEKFIESHYAGKESDKSCEVIAREIGEFFCTRLPECEEVRVSVSGEPSKTWLTAHFKKEAKGCLVS